MRYRKATVGDTAELTDLRLEFLREATGREHEREDALRSSIQAYISSHLPTGEFVAWLCIEGDRIVGTSGISFYALPPNYTCPNGKVGYIMNMYTKEPYRRRGVARALFEKMLEEGRSSGVSKFILHATDNGRGLYAQFGFVMSGDEMHLTV
jgi:GNAT superfamily N-acetyltransferase